MNKHDFPVHGAGLGLRRSLMQAIADQPPAQLGFMEIAPENWINVGGAMGRQFSALAEQYAMTAHGLSLSIGSPAPLDEAFLYKVKKFIQKHNIRSYSDHLSYCSDDGHLYDLMPIPFTEEAVHYVAARIRRAQDILEQRIAMENVSYYTAPGQEMLEIDFINAVISEADCDFLLDVNNIFVNSINHKYDAIDFLNKLPAERVTYVHIAGHYIEDEDLIVDTHGADVVDTVWNLLHKSYEIFGVMPTLLERDFNIPPLPELLTEVDTIIQIQKKWNKQTDSQTQHG